MNFSNNSTLLEYQLVEEFSLKTKVCTGLIAPVLVLLIIFLNFGIAYYERFGNDPQKRNLYNMMITSFFMVFSTSTTFWVVFVSIRIIQGPFDVSNTFTFIVILIYHIFSRIIKLSLPNHFNCRRVGYFCSKIN